MKRVLVFLLLVSLTVQGLVSRPRTEKGTVTVMARENLMDRLPGHIAYLLPEFSDALLYRNDGGVSEGKINVCLVDNSIRFVSESGDTLMMTGYSQVHTFNAGDSVYVRVGEVYMRQLAAYGKILLAERTRLELKESSGTESASGGMVPPTSTAVKASVSSLDPSRRFVGKTDIDYSLTTDVVLTDGQNAYVARMQAFVRMFPEKKKEIKAFVKEHSIDFDSMEDLVSLFMFCSGNNN